MLPSFPAMGTTVWTDTGADVDAVRRLFKRVEQVASRFRDTSELTAVNRVDRSPLEVSPLLGSLLVEAQELRRRTRRLVDPAVGSLVADWGYDRTFDEIREAAQTPVRTRAGWWHIEQHLLWKDPTTRLDLGGIAKGWTADLAVTLGLAVVVNAGGDLRSSDPETIVDVEDPWGRVAASIPVGVGALATSSRTTRTWQAGDIDAHHVIDPRTGAPAVTPVLSATAVAETAVEAEAAAKAILLLGEDGLVWADRQSWVRSAVAVWHDGSVYATSSVEVAA